MASTEITLINKGGKYSPSTASVAVVKGETVTFSTSDGSIAFLFFSPAAAAVLSPAPGNAFQLTAGKKATFTFTASSPGAYSVAFGANASSAPASFSGGNSSVLVLEGGGAERVGAVAPGSFGNPMKPGS
ncbi:MAG: hypothetical protein ABSF16_04145 [Terracidiphilus sp.]|jgi:hypothetical protein